MPIYEYECTGCGFRDDVLQKLSDDPLVTCPKCGQATFEKQISAPSFRLKGGGWYETDFKSGNKRNLVESGSSSSGDSGTSAKSSDSTSSSASSTPSTSSTPKASGD